MSSLRSLRPDASVAVCYCRVLDGDEVYWVLMACSGILLHCRCRPCRLVQMYSLCWYKSTNTDATSTGAGGSKVAAGVVDAVADAVYCCTAVEQVCNTARHPPCTTKPLISHQRPGRQGGKKAVNIHTYVDATSCVHTHTRTHTRQAEFFFLAIHDST